MSVFVCEHHIKCNIGTSAIVASPHYNDIIKLSQDIVVHIHVIVHVQSMYIISLHSTWSL